MVQADGRGGHQTLLVIDPREAGWDPAQGSPGLCLAAELARLGVHPIVAVPIPALGGAWTDVVDGLEVIRLGYPEPPRPRGFDPFDPRPGPDNLFVRHWERIVFARSVRVVLTWTGRLAGPLRRGLGGQDVAWWGLVEDWSRWSPESWRAPRPGGRGLLPLSKLIVLEDTARSPGPPPSLPSTLSVERVPPASLSSFLVERLESAP